MDSRPTLVGDGIENPLNARTMLHAAEMFGSRCLFRDRKGLADATRLALPDQPPFSLITRQALAAEYAPLIACDNFEQAPTVYDFKPPAGERPALLLGNERRGLAEDLRTLASGAVQIPMVSRQLNCLNVAAAAAVALYYLGSPRTSRSRPRRGRAHQRPALLLLGASDHVELGSAIRSAGAFGWSSLLVDDRAGVWFGAARAVQTEGRAAARRARNPIKLIPANLDQRYSFEEAVVVSCRANGEPLSRTELTGGAGQLIVIPDDEAVDPGAERWERLAPVIRFARVDLPVQHFTYHYRLIATIALAEAARQLGPLTTVGAGRSPRPHLRYDRALDLLTELPGETVWLEDLAAY